MDYLGLLKKAFHLTLKNRFLWIFGIFAGVGGGLGSATSYSPDFKADKTNLGGKISSFDCLAFFNQHAMLILSLLLGFLLLAIVFFVLEVISQAALIGAADKLSKQEKANFAIGFKIGVKNFWRLWGVMIIYCLLISASLLVLIIPATVFVLSHLYVLAVIWGILTLFLNIAFLILIGLMVPYSYRMIVLSDIAVFASVREALHFVKKNLLEVVLTYLILWGTGLAFGAGIVLGFLLVISLFGAIGYGLWLASAPAAIAYGILVGAGVVALMVVLGGAYAAFYSTVLTLTYNQLKHR